MECWGKGENVIPTKAKICCDAYRYEKDCEYYHEVRKEKFIMGFCLRDCMVRGKDGD